MAENEPQKPRIVSFIVVICIAFFGPILFFSSSNWLTQISEGLSNAWSSSSEVDTMSLGLASTEGEIPGELSDSVDSIVELEPVYRLDEVLRFDATTGWILQRWPHVSTGLAHLQLQGYRVPLVTGTSENDLAGALTYYFNSQQQVQRITIQGTTGDARNIIHLVTSRWGLQRRLTNDPAHFVYDLRNRHGEATSFLWIRPAGFVDTDRPDYRFHVALALERSPNR